MYEIKFFSTEIAFCQHYLLIIDLFSFKVFVCSHSPERLLVYFSPGYMYERKLFHAERILFQRKSI